jgi:hypothetical protein
LIAIIVDKLIEDGFTGGDGGGAGCVRGVFCVKILMVTLGTVIQLKQNSSTVLGSPVKNWQM